MSAPDPIAALLEKLPEDERPHARKSIDIALSYQWERFRFWTHEPPMSLLCPNEPARCIDLVADDPHGRLRMLWETD